MSQAALLCKNILLFPSSRNPQETIYICSSIKFEVVKCLPTSFPNTFGNRNTGKLQNKSPFRCQGERSKIILLGGLFPFSSCLVCHPWCAMSFKINKQFIVVLLSVSFKVVYMISSTILLFSHRSPPLVSKVLVRYLQVFFFVVWFVE